MTPTSNGGCEVVGGSTGSGGSYSDIAAAPAAIHGGGGGGGGVDMVAHPHGGGKLLGGGDVNGEAYLKKGPWTAEEDAILVEYVRKHGEGNWNAVQRHSGLSRCGKSCRLRWANHLRPNLKKGAFSPQEERLIVELHAKFGNKWARMASLLPGRTDNEIKNYWNTRVKRHQRQGLPLYPPDIQPQQPPSPHFHHHFLHHNSQSTSTTTTTTTPTSMSSFSFQPHHFPTQNTATTPTSMTPPLSPSASFPTLPLSDYSQHQHHHQQQLHHHHQYNPPHHHSSHSTPTTPTSSFSFQTQLPSPNHPHTPQTTKSSTTTAISSPSTTALPVFDFSIPRTPPILQTPIRFKRFSSTPDTEALASNHHHPPFSLPCPPTSASNTHQLPSCFASYLNGSNNSPSDFHSELQKENQEMCSLLAAVSQPELPSNQFVSTTNHNRNFGIGIVPAVCKFGRRATKKKFGNYVKDKVSGKLGFAIEDLLQEANLLTESGGQDSVDQSNLIFQDQKYGSHWDKSNFLALSPETGMEGKVEDGGHLNMTAEEFNQVLDSLPCSMQQQTELHSDSADMSNGQSSVVTDENNMGYDMQQIASLFSPTEHGRNLTSCSWDNVQGICHL